VVLGLCCGGYGDVVVFCLIFLEKGARRACAKFIFCHITSN